MQKRKVLSMFMASAIIASQLSVVAFADSGSVTADVTTQNAIVRVQVPTTMAVAIDQFEISQTGAQINSSEFTMVNNSQMAVKVDVKSTATTSTAVDLVATKAAATASTATTGEAWLAVAAATASGSYTDGSQTNWYDLTNANKNVTSFPATTGTTVTSDASQTFYLAKGTGVETYKLEIPAANAKSSVGTYAKYYELTAATMADQDALTAALASSDVYSVVTDDIANAAAVTKIAKGATATFASTNTYYTVATTNTAVADLVKDSLYVWGEMATDGGKAAFRYVGALGNAKAIWTKDDISGITIEYTITGVTSTNYDTAAADCVYGLYTEEAAPSVTTITGTTITNSGATTTYGTAADLATRLKTGAVSFHMATGDVTSLNGLSVTKITIDGTDFTGSNITTATATATSGCDGKTYQLTGYTGTAAKSISVYYGTTYVVTYTLN